ncbi:sensor histidine kinase [Saccharopolyspora erythraea]|uniref:sensor histidine kinase n=1 Tax=Saccharopolyspora erythraea TaxID=1836 RepID=UPI001BABD67A|nr:sensor histidine kinase [Saccharopolyspora erythraea]QUH00613.1 sensor histidine kinase [Saccharopolyspora erythraea]
MRFAVKPDPRVLGTDAAFAALLGAVVVMGSRFASVWQVPPHRPLDALAYVLLGLAAAALALRRVWPVAALTGAATVTAGYLASDYPYGPVFLTVAFAAYSAAARLPLRRSAILCGGALVVVMAGHVPRLVGPRFWVELPSALLGATALLVVPWAIGTIARMYRESARRGREEQARRRAYEERIRVVQEVHDVVGHGLSAINFQSAVALHVLDQRPEQARPALEAIRRTSKEALDELRGTLAVFRRPESGDRGPTPGLGQLDALAGRITAAGLPVRTSTTGERGELPAAVDLAAYRIVQESLTNVLRHAGPATATVVIGYLPGAVEVRVSDDGRARLTDDIGSGGHGIVGMRERAAAVGGTLDAGPRPEGGFLVHAHLPFGGSR